jgi:hypothetical protein
MVHKINVTAQDDQVPRIDELADRLRAAGMRVEQVLRPVGVITGSITSAELTSIKSMPGVAAVEEQTSFHLPPPDAGIQ